MERTPNKSRHTKVNSEEENSPAGIRTRNLSITSPALYEQAIPAPYSQIQPLSLSAGVMLPLVITCRRLPDHYPTSFPRDSRPLLLRSFLFQYAHWQRTVVAVLSNSLEKQ